MCDLIEHCEIDALDLEDSKAAHEIVFFPHIKTKVPQVPQMGHQWGTKRDPNTFLIFWVLFKGYWILPEISRKISNFL